MKGMAISNEQKVAAFDGIMRLVGIHALGEWFGSTNRPTTNKPILMITKFADKYFYFGGHFESANDRFIDDSDEELKCVICWKYDDAENIVKLLKF